nr:sec23/sec24 transport family protein [Tanacetum cinerariifolium]
MSLRMMDLLLLSNQSKVCDMRHASALDFASRESQTSTILVEVEVEIEHSLDDLGVNALALSDRHPTYHETPSDRETATYCKIWDNEDVHDLESVETEFPAIVFNDMLTSKATISYEPTVSSLNNDEIDFRISFDESNDEDYTSLKEEMYEMHKNYNNRGDDHASENDDTPMCERREAYYIQSKGYQNRYTHDSYFHQSHYDPKSNNDFEKSLTELNYDVKHDLEDFKRCILSMRIDYDKLYEKEPQSKTDIKKSIAKFLDGQTVTHMFFKNNVNDMIIKMKQNENNFQTKFKNLERKIDEWSKSQNVSSNQTNRTDPPPPPAQTEHVNVVFTRSGKSDDPLKTQKRSTSYHR